MREIALFKPRPGPGLLIVAAAILMLLVAGAVHIRFARQMVNLVSDQFNQEQLAVARNIRKLVEQSLGSLERDLVQLADRIGATPPDSTALQNRLQGELERLGRRGVVEIQIWDEAAGKMWTYARGTPLQDMPATLAPLGFERRPEPGETLITRPEVVQSRVLFSLITTLGGHRDAFLVFRINVPTFLTPLLTDVRSGLTGYAWIIDSRGRFLYHPFRDYIGKSAFEVRRETFPDLSFVHIDQIQRDEMLEGREGTGTYQSFWHRGITGKIDKLIAYCPIHISQAPVQFWSVAVVAPTHEIANAVGQIHRWQMTLQGLIILVVAGAAGVLILFEIRFSRRLEKLVNSRTQALKRSEEKYRLLVESAEDLILTLDETARLKSVNSYTAHFFGSDAELLVDRPLSDLLSDDMARLCTKAVERVYATARSVREEIEIRSVDPPVWLNANFMPLRNEAGDIHAVLCIARDVTENKNLQRNLIATEKLAALGTLAAGVAHEINNPLGVILGFCDLLVRKQPPGSQAYEDLKIIERQGMHCKEIVDNLLSFARDRKVSEESTDLNQCLEEIIKVARHSIERQNVTVTLDTARRLPPVRGDSRQLQQVFLNLMNNAVAAMPDGGDLMISTALDKGSRRAVITVADTGCGIPEGDLERIFEPFFTTKPEGQGTGLGLFVSYGIVSSFGGSIQCDCRISKTRDRGGTTFTVKLPLCPQEAK